MNRDRKISVIGMGYVGLPVAAAFGRIGEVVGFDVDAGRIAELRAGTDRTGEIPVAELRAAKIHFTADAKDLRWADFHIVAVPTPITAAKHPNMAPLLQASEILAAQLKQGDVVVYESTVYPGATEEECVPVLERVSGLRAGADFFYGYSPERINPGDRKNTFRNIVKVVSGQNAEILDLVAETYAKVVDAGVHRAPSVKVAEASKIVENAQRDVNIALMNELAMIFRRLGIDSGDVLAAARTKWNFLPFTPGLVGGHCIGVDPYYLTYKATATGLIPDLILDARAINDGMAEHVSMQLIRALIQAGAARQGGVVTILGLTFKENVGDIRNSRVIDIVGELRQCGLAVQVHDPRADRGEARRMYGLELRQVEELEAGDAVLLAVPHREFMEEGWALIARLLRGGRGVVFDVRGVLPRESAPAGVLLLRL
jgi:UDP-N-acetyl-D-galactosamine dehydrogenase